MDSRKIQRVRRLIADNIYTDPQILDSLERMIVERHFEQLLSDIEKCCKINRERSDEQAIEVY